MDVSVLEHPTSAPVVVTASAGAMNTANTQVAQFVPAWLGDNEVRRVVAENRVKVPAPAVLAQFAQEDFCNDRLSVLYRLGVKGYVIGIPSPALVQQICAPILGYSLHETKFGQMLLQGRFLFLGKKHVELTPRLSLLFKELLEARGGYVSQSRLYMVYRGSTVELNTHTLQTQIYRLRASLTRLGLIDVLTSKNPGGYRLKLD